MSVTYRAKVLAEGQPSDIHRVVYAALAECPEMTWQSKPLEAACRIVESAEEHDRIELTAWDGHLLVGIIVLVEDADDQVGPLLGTQWFYVRPGYRGTAGLRLMRYAQKTALGMGYRVMAYTHRLAEGKYEINYQRLVRKEKSHG